MSVRRRPLTLGVLAAGALAAATGLFVTIANGSSGGSPVPRNGYFGLRPVGSYAALPDDAKAAMMVHRSTWEPRPQNTSYNHVTPTHLALQPKDPRARAYDPRWNRYVLGRTTGHYTGTTDEIFQWAAAKWGVPDNVIRAVAMSESTWHQQNEGDRVTDPAQCLPGYVSVPCPQTFGITGVKSPSWPGVYPWNRLSTATSVDVLGGWLRGCYEGWVWWLRDHANHSRGVYRAGDLWGCVGAWYSGDWHDGSVGAPSGEYYIARTRHFYDTQPWRRPHF
jgi:autotransporter family porin